MKDNGQNNIRKGRGYLSPQNMGDPRMMGLTYHPHSLIGMGDATPSHSINWKEEILTVVMGIESVIAQADELNVTLSPELLTEVTITQRLSSDLRSNDPESIIEKLVTLKRELQRPVTNEKARQTRERNQKAKARKAARLQAEKEAGTLELNYRWFFCQYTKEDWRSRLTKYKGTKWIPEIVLLPGGYSYVKVIVQEAKKGQQAWGKDRYQRGHILSEEAEQAIAMCLGSADLSRPIPEQQVLQSANSTNRVRWADHLSYWL